LFKHECRPPPASALLVAAALFASCLLTLLDLGRI